MAGVENPLSADQVEPHDGAGAAPQLLGDVEVALATLKGFAVSDRDAQTSQTVVEVMELMNAKIAKVRADDALRRLGRTAITSPPGLCYTWNHYVYK